MSLSALQQTIINSLPQTGVTLIFGYGSKVIRQSGEQAAGDLVDIIIAVNDPLKWHQENYRLNSHHYSFLRYLPNNIATITRIQECYGARIYFNPFVSVGNLSIKYGVIKTDHLVDDLVAWSKLYVAGRLHKPVEFIVNTCNRDEPLRLAMRSNKESAIRSALIQLPETFNPSQLYRTIAGLSYRGDLRMIFGEDRNKIDNIVSAQRDRLDQLFLPILKSNQNFKDNVQWSESKQHFSQDLSSSTLLKYLRLLPSNVRQTICEIHSREARTLELDAVLASASRSIDCDKILATALAKIVRRSSSPQALKGLMTAGFWKSLRYSQRKLSKSLVSRINF